MRRLIFILPLVLFAVLAGYFALGLTRDPSVVPSALIDKPVPEFTLPPLLKDGQGLASADLKGKVQLVNVFASWCVPCRIEHPVLMRLAKEQGVTVKAINYKDKPEDAVRWLEPGRQSLQRHRRRSGRPRCRSTGASTACRKPT